MDVRNIFINIRRSELEYEDDFVRLALIYFFECDLLGKESQYDKLKSYMQALDIKIDGVTNDLGNFRLDSMHKIDGVADDLDSFRLNSMREFQSIHNTMREMFDYIKHDATHNDDVKKMP
ncbi:hypothetical protein FNV43_RR12847 [Rhamnella rubrinervis]|uniref:Uncharacterized protein n=1 Tax=Rhamnella rubrinervis TaxID=2594499 RepID=A0A8K0MEC3_9ROSA|nr:hypothetical protein FNV43_RR12847 [Rhamnella rubrinervis]